MAALHELRDRGLIVGRHGCYTRHGGRPSEWYAVWPWPLLYCSAPRIAKDRPKEEPTPEARGKPIPWSKREKAKEFVPVDGEPEEDTGLVDRSPTSLGKGQRRLEI